MTTLVNYMNIGNAPTKKALAWGEERTIFLREKLKLSDEIKIIVIPSRLGEDRLELLDI
jgi:hypothetical protein